MKRFTAILIGLFIVLVLLFDRNTGTAQYANYLFPVVFLLSASSIINMIVKESERPFLLSILFSIWCFFSLLWCFDFGNGISKAITVLLMQLIFFMIASYDNRDLSHFIQWFYIGTTILLIESIIGFGGISKDVIETSTRTETGLMDDNYTGKVLSIGATISLYYFYYKKRIYFLVLFIIYVITILVLKTKGGLLAVLIGSITLSFLYFRKLNKVGLFGVIMIASFVVMGVVIKSGIFGDAFIRMEQMLDFFSSNDSNEDASTYTRLMLIERGFNLFLQQPITGFGIGSAEAINQGWYFHNNYVQLLVETGLVGFLLYYSIIVWLLKKLSRFSKDEIHMLFISLIILLLFSDISNTTYYIKLHYVIFGMAMLCIRRDKKALLKYN